MKKIRLFTKSLRLVWASAPGWTLINIAVSVGRSILPLALVFLIKVLIDKITAAAATGTGQAGDILPLILAVVAVFFLDEVSLEFSAFVRKKQALKLESFMYGLLHRKSVSLDLINFEHPSYFDCLSRASAEAPWRPGSILNNLVSVFRGMISLLLMGILLASLEWWLVIILLAVNIPAVWLRLHFADVLYDFQKKQTPEARKSSYFNWLLTGDRPARELRLFGLGEYFINLFRESFTKHKEKELDIIKRRTAIELISNVFKAAALLLVLLFIGNRTISGNLSLGQMAMFILAFRQGMLYIREIFGSVAGLYEDSLFIGNVFDFLDLNENITANDPAIKPDELKESISAENLTFSYPGNPVPVIKNISFTIRKGEVLALVGHNGAGKSTLVRLLCRLYDPDAGVIRYDGKDIKQMDPAEYRKQFSVVFQDFMLYNLSAGENIRLGNVFNNNDQTAVEGSARATGVHELISSLPGGYETLIGNLFDESRELSWGEWQKIALARSLYRNAPVLILDEPSSALDADSEYQIFSRLKELIKGKTTILITHRFTNVKLADRIIVMSEGAVEEAGSHEELMNKKGTYFQMYTRQSSRFGDEKGA